MTTRHLTIAIDADAENCGACAYAHRYGGATQCDLFQSWITKDRKRDTECIGYESDHAAAIAQARREERARCVDLVRRMAATCIYETSRSVLRDAADTLEREP